jgi:hypothetical protein
MAKILMMSERRVIGTTPIFVMRISYMAQIQPPKSPPIRISPDIKYPLLRQKEVSVPQI